MCLHRFDLTITEFDCALHWPTDWTRLAHNIYLYIYMYILLHVYIYIPFCTHGSSISVTIPNDTILYYTILW